MPGFVAGGMGSFGGSLFQGMAGEIMQAHPILEAIGTVGSSAVSGGVGAELTGGDFWRGAATGAIVGAFNHVGDKGDNLLHNKMKKYKNYGDVDGLNIEYGAYKDANDWTGVEISIEYTGADFSGSHWEQYIETNYPASRIRDRAYKGHNVKYWDDEYTGNRHYYTDKQMEKHILNGGRTVTFRDIPSRPPADGSTYWKGNLYLIRDNKAILKLYYSYTSNNNKITFTPILIGH